MDMQNVSNTEVSTTDLTIISEKASENACNDSTSIKNKEHQIDCKDETHGKLNEEVVLSEESHAECLQKSQKLELQLKSYEKEVEKLKEHLGSAENQFKKQQHELELQYTNLQKQLSKAIKEKEEAVVRFAVSEKSAIDINALKKEIEILESKLKRAVNEKARICSLLDTKTHELLSANKEKEQLKLENNQLQNKLKVYASNYKAETESKTALEKKCENLQIQLDKVQGSFQINEQACQDSQKLVSVEKLLTESQAQLILERHKNNDLELKYNKIHLQFTEVSSDKDALEKKVDDLTQQVKNLESNLEQLEISYKETRNKELEVTHKQIFEAQTTILNNEQEIERLRVLNEEITNELNVSHKKETELLQFTKALTEQNVVLQSKISSLEAKVLGHSTEEQLLKSALNKQTEKMSTLQKELNDQQQKNKDECDVLVRHLATKTEALERLELKLAESQGEIEVLKRKHSAVIKELNRELQHAKKNQSRDSISLVESNGPNTGSNSSLSSIEPTSNSQSNHDQEILVERILKLQKIKAKQAEKLDFLEEHCKALVVEIQNKTRLMQTLLLRSNYSKSDTSVLSNSEALKEEPQITLEMSQLMNKNLQALLEDTLLKNVALKENVDMLASEVMRLNKVN